MLISRNWLQSYFETELPTANEIAETLLLHAFEIEKVIEKGDDWIIDIDVLPNRAHDCLSHAGIASEYAVLISQVLKNNRYHYHNAVHYNHELVPVDNKNSSKCYRYCARKLVNISVGESPEWLKNRLSSIGQKTINNIVDATNYVMFDTGQPIHVFDADKVVGGITVRNAEKGEIMVTLTGEELNLEPSDLVISDDEGILALAGVKGGQKAEVDVSTKNIIIEVANFNPLSIRQTARRVKIQTDSSKRYENGISSELAPLVLEKISMLISDCAHTKNIELGEIADIYPTKEETVTIKVELKKIQALLGITISEEEVSDIFERLNYQYHTKNEIFDVHIPHLRLDLRISEDLVEEIGRIYGYYNIQAQNLDEYTFKPELNLMVYIQERIRNILIECGLYDIMNYAFEKKGDIEVLNPLASDKKALRKNLYSSMQKSLDQNVKSADFFGLDRIALFELGQVYTKEGQETLCCIGVHNINKKARKKYGEEKVQLELFLEKINQYFNTNILGTIHGTTISFDLKDIEKNMKSVKSYGDIFENDSYGEEDRFHSISPYPFIKRDISLWAKSGLSDTDIQKIIKANSSVLLRKIFLFDQFEKEGRVSYAYSLIFQSKKKTLTDKEVEQDMKKIIESLENKNCEIR